MDADSSDQAATADEADATGTPEDAPGTVTVLRGRWMRRVAAAVAFVVVLGAVGLGYSFFAPASHAAGTNSSSADVLAGQHLFNQTCITCHGVNLQGVKDRGPSLIGVGQASVYFQVRTGRMPLSQQGAQSDGHISRFTETQIEQLAAYVQQHGGGPVVPQGNLRDDSKVGAGGNLFRLNCASCHSVTGKGGALSGGKFAPDLKNATDQEIYAAMLTGPGQMPVFGNNQITPAQKKAIISYVQSMKAEANAGGWGIGRLGPVPEGLVAWVVGIGLLLLIIFWIGRKTAARGPEEPRAEQSRAER